MMRLLLTRPMEDSLPMAEHLEKMGIQCLIAPMLTIHRIPNGAIADTYGLLPTRVPVSDEERPWYARLLKPASYVQKEIIREAEDRPQAIIITSHHAAQFELRYARVHGAHCCARSVALNRARLPSLVEIASPFSGRSLCASASFFAHPR